MSVSQGSCKCTLAWRVNHTVSEWSASLVPFSGSLAHRELSLTSQDVELVAGKPKMFNPIKI
eukprot:1156112-Amphidinium_carterae.1